MWICIREKAHGNQRLVHRGELDHILEGTPRQLSEAGDGRGGLRDHDESSEGLGREARGTEQLLLLFESPLSVCCL